MGLKISVSVGEKMQKVFVAGATGYLGQYLVCELKRQGYWVRALVRNTAQVNLVTAADDIVVGQVTEPTTLMNLADGMDIVISTVGITRQKDGMTYMDVDYQGNSNLLREAERSAVQHFVYVSAIDGDKHQDLKIFQAKERFVNELKRSTIASTVIRPNGYFSDMRDFLNMAASGRIYLFGDGKVKINPISGRDLAKFIVSGLSQPQNTLSVGGPEILSLNEISQIAAQVLNREIKIKYLPDWLRKATIVLARRLTSQKTYGPIEFFLTFMGESHIGQQVGSDRLSDFYQEEAKKLPSCKKKNA